LAFETSASSALWPGGNQAGKRLLVEYVPGHGDFAFIDSCDAVEELLKRKADVAIEKSLHPLIRDEVLAEAVPL
jgi:predicted nucleotidyltransferase